MGQYTEAVQKLYVAYFNRPADPGGLRFWEDIVTANGGDTSAVSNAFAVSTEYQTTYAGKNSLQLVDQVYQNLFGRGGEVGGLLYWSNKLDTGALSLSNIVTAISASAVGTDADAYASKVAAGTAFTNALDTAAELLGYSGTDANNAAKTFMSRVTDAATLATEIAALDTTVNTVVEIGNGQNNKGTTYNLTTSIDGFVGGKGNDTFKAVTSNQAQTLTSFDDLDGGAGIDSLVVVSDSNKAVTLPTSIFIKNIEKATLTADNTITGSTASWTGLTSLTTSTLGGFDLTAASTTALNMTDGVQAAGMAKINGGSSVNLNLSGATTGEVSVAGATGAVVINRATTGAVNAGTITVNGGTTIDITQTATNAVNTTQTNGSVTVIGTAATTTVTVKAAAEASAKTGVGINDNSVTITDVNNGKDAAGSIKNVSVDGFDSATINGNAVSTLVLANGTGAVTINNDGMTTPTNKTLAVTLNKVNGSLEDMDIYTTLNLTLTGADSALDTITMSKLTTLNIAGTKSVTLDSGKALSSLTSIVVTGSAGLVSNGLQSMGKLATVSTAGSTGSSTVTITGNVTAYTGGAGVDNVTVTAGSTKAIALGDGNDALTLQGDTAPTAALAGGGGTGDVLGVTANLAAAASADSKFAGLVTGFERVVLSGSTNQTVKLDVLGGFNHVTTSGGNGLTLSNLPTGGTLALNGAGTAYTISHGSFAAAASDTINLSLSSAAAVSFASTGITATDVENFVIANDDTNATPAGDFINAVTILGTSAKSITVSGDAGLTLTAASTALTTVDASGISKGGFVFVSGALAGAAVIKGSATGSNDVNVSAATKAVTYTGGTGVDLVTVAGTGLNHSLTLGDGANTVVGGDATGAVTVGAGAGDDIVTLGTGNNVVSLGAGANQFTATSGNNIYTGGAGVDTVTVGGGSNTLTLGTGADIVTFTAASKSVNVYSSITDAHAGVVINLPNLGTETFTATKVTLAATAVFQDYANAVVAAGGNASVNAASGWFQFGGDTYYVQSRHDGSGAPSFVNGTDFVIKLTGTVDLATATFNGAAAANSLTLA